MPGAARLNSCVIGTSSAFHCRRYVNQDRALGGLPNGQVGAAVAGVDEVPSHLLLDRRQLGAALEIVYRVGGEHCVEQAEMRGHRFGDTAMRGCGQHEASTKGFFFLQVFKQVLAVGPGVACGEIDGTLRDACLERAAPLQQP